MTQTATIRTPGPDVPDGVGGWLPGPSTVTTAKCRVEYIGRDEMEAIQGGSVRALGDRRIVFPLGSPVTQSSVIEVEGRRYAVVSLDTGTAHRPDLRAICTLSE